MTTLRDISVIIIYLHVKYQHMMMMTTLIYLDNVADKTEAIINMATTKPLRPTKKTKARKKTVHFRNPNPVRNTRTKCGHDTILTWLPYSNVTDNPDRVTCLACLNSIKSTKKKQWMVHLRSLNPARETRTMCGHSIRTGRSHANVRDYPEEVTCPRCIELMNRTKAK